MAKRKRTDFQREADLPKIADLYRAGHTQRAISQQFGLSQGQICQDLAEIKRRWKAESVEFFTSKIEEELSKIDNLEITYWNQFDESRQDEICITVETKTVTLKGDDGGDSVDLPATETKRTIKTTKRVGDRGFLTGVEWCIERRCKLLGLDAPAKSELTGKDGGALTVRIIYDDTDIDTNATQALTLAATGSA